VDEGGSTAPQRFEVASVGFGQGDRWRRWWARIMLGTPLLLGLCALLPTRRAPLPGEFFVPGDLTYAWWTAAFWIGFALTLVAALAWRSVGRRAGPRRSEPSAVVELSPHRFVVRLPGGERAYDRRDIEHLFDDHAEKNLVIRLRGGRELSLGAPTAVRRAILAALGPDPACHAAVVPIGSLAASFASGEKLATGGFVLGLLAAVGLFGSIGEKLLGAAPIPTSLWVTFAVGVVSTLGLGLALRRRQVVVGSDGVRVDGLVRRRFIPHAEVQVVHTTARGTVELERKGRLDVSLPTVPPGAGLEQRIEAARAIPPGTGDARVGEALDRGERTQAEWREALGRLLDGGTYRDGAIRTEELEAVVDDPHAAPEQRVAAAVALAADEGRRGRVRIAAEACADRDLAAALEAGAEGEIAERRLARASRRFDASRPGQGD
jgi:hypothetical protein